MAEESPAEAFDRGHTAGDIAAQLRGHDQHFMKINGSVDRTADELASLRSEVAGLRSDVRTLASEALAAAATVVTTARALKEAEDTRRRTAEQSWTPYQRAFAVVAALAAAAGLLVLVRGW